MLDIAIIAHGLPFDGGTLERRGLGGSETAVIYVARELQKLGHNVTVFSNPDQPGNYAGVNYVPVQQLQKMSSVMEWDVLIVSRQWNLLSADIKARYRVLWNHDVFTSPQMFASLWQTDKTFLLSDYHIKNYTEGDDKVPEFKDLIFKTSNGIDMELINKCKEGVEKVPGKIIYTSRPERGLHYLLQMIPDIVKMQPDAKIYYCNYDLGKLVPHESDQQRLKVIEQLLEQYKDHVVNLGHLTKEELYKEMASAVVHAYPSAFPEISCCAEGTLIQMPCDRAEHPHGVPIEDLIDKTNFPVYAYDADEHKFVLATCKKVWQTGENRECLEIELDDGNVLTVTPEHLVMDFDGEWHAAADLEVGMRLNALHQRYNVMIKDTNGRWVDEHRLVGTWKAGRQLSRNEHVDHLDETRLNNSPEMLQVLSASEHHSKTFTGNRRSRKSLEKQAASYLAYLDTAEGQEDLRQRGERRGNKFWQEVFPSWPPAQQHEFLLSRARARKNLIPVDHARRMVELRAHGTSYQKIAEVLAAEDMLNGNGNQYHASSVRRQVIRSKEFSRQNHKIVAIRKSVKTHTVYDMEVEKYHNFVANGVVVHNCITAMEAPGCGTPIVTTNNFALSETVGHNRSGFLINGTPAAQPGSMELNPVYKAKFVRKVLQIMGNPHKQQKFAKTGPQWILDQGYTWEAVAKSWSDLFLKELVGRFDKSPDAVANELERQGQFVAADILRGGEVNDVISMPQVKGTDEEALALQQEVQGIDASLRTNLKKAPKTVLIAYPSNPVLAVLLPKIMPKAKFTVLENEETLADATRQVLDSNGLKSVQVVDTAKEQYDLIVCQDSLSHTKDPEKLVAMFNKLLTKDGMALYTTHFGPRTVRVPEIRDRLWSIGPAEWNDILNGKRGGLSFLRLGTTKNQETFGKWVACVPYYEDFVPGQINIERYKFTRPYQKLTCCMIAYNAEDWIVRCMNRVLEVADKVQIVIDTKTNDRTVELLETFADDRIEWWYNDFEDFESQRNESLRGVGEQEEPGWVLWLDTDEMLVQEVGLRKFLNGEFFNGYAIPQCHLMLDVHGNRDNPVRLFRAGKPGYRFVGCIHEHAEDTSKGGYDNPITPSMIISQVQLAHYGYENEKQRRQKCSNRNMALLQKDMQKHPDRLLNKLLALRDYLHPVKWDLEAMRQRGEKPDIQPGSKLHKILETAIDIYLKFLSDPKSKYHVQAVPHYQDALQILAMCNLPYRGCPTPPFSLATAVSAGVGGPARNDLQQEVTWFRSIEEAGSWLNGNMRGLAKQIAPYPDKILDMAFPVVEAEQEVKFEDKDGALLSLGKDRIDEHGILR